MQYSTEKTKLLQQDLEDLRQNPCMISKEIKTL
jgi:hypothetical protein